MDRGEEVRCVGSCVRRVLGREKERTIPEILEDIKRLTTMYNIQEFNSIVGIRSGDHLDQTVLSSVRKHHQPDRSVQRTTRTRRNGSLSSF